jgi:hypothetical protein
MRLELLTAHRLDFMLYFVETGTVGTIDDKDDCICSRVMMGPQVATLKQAKGEGRKEGGSISVCWCVRVCVRACDRPIVGLRMEVDCVTSSENVDTDVEILKRE